MRLMDLFGNVVGIGDMTPLIISSSGEFQRYNVTVGGVALCHTSGAPLALLILDAQKLVKDIEAMRVLQTERVVLLQTGDGSFDLKSETPQKKKARKGTTK